jgi:hypothetical protein
MTEHGHPDLRIVAEKVADGLAYSGLAYVEDDQLDDLALVIETFLSEAGITVQVPDVV